MVKMTISKIIFSKGSLKNSITPILERSMDEMIKGKVL